MIETLWKSAQQSKTVTEILHERVSLRELSNWMGKLCQGYIGEHEGGAAGIAKWVEHASRQRGIGARSPWPPHHVVECHPVRTRVQSRTRLELSDSRRVNGSWKRTDGRL